MAGLLVPQNNMMIAPGFSITIGGLNERTDAKSIIRAFLVSLRTELNGAATRATDPLSKYHFQDLSDRVGKALDPNK